MQQRYERIFKLLSTFIFLVGRVNCSDLHCIATEYFNNMQEESNDGFVIYENVFAHLETKNVLHISYIDGLNTIENICARFLTNPRAEIPNCTIASIESKCIREKITSQIDRSHIFIYYDDLTANADREIYKILAKYAFKDVETILNQDRSFEKCNRLHCKNLEHSYQSNIEHFNRHFYRDDKTHDKIECTLKKTAESELSVGETHRGCLNKRNNSSFEMRKNRHATFDDKIREFDAIDTAANCIDDYNMCKTFEYNSQRELETPLSHKSLRFKFKNSFTESVKKIARKRNRNDSGYSSTREFSNPNSPLTPNFDHSPLSCRKPQRTTGAFGYDMQQPDRFSSEFSDCTDFDDVHYFDHLHSEDSNSSQSDRKRINRQILEDISSDKYDFLNYGNLIDKKESERLLVSLRKSYRKDNMVTLYDKIFDESEKGKFCIIYFANKKDIRAQITKNSNYKLTIQKEIEQANLDDSNNYSSRIYNKIVLTNHRNCTHYVSHTILHSFQNFSGGFFALDTPRFCVSYSLVNKKEYTKAYKEHEVRMLSIFDRHTKCTVKIYFVFSPEGFLNFAIDSSDDSLCSIDIIYSNFKHLLTGQHFLENRPIHYKYFTSHSLLFYYYSLENYTTSLDDLKYEITEYGYLGYRTQWYSYSPRLEECNLKLKKLSKVLKSFTIDLKQDYPDPLDSFFAADKFLRRNRLKFPIEGNFRFIKNENIYIIDVFDDKRLINQYQIVDVSSLFPNQYIITRYKRTLE